MPETVAPHLEEVSEEALRERVQLRKVTAAVELYDQLLQTGSYTALQRACPERAQKNSNLTPYRHSHLYGNHPPIVGLDMLLWGQRPCTRGGATD